ETSAGNLRQNIGQPGYPQDFVATNGKPRKIRFPSRGAVRSIRRMRTIGPKPGRAWLGVRTRKAMAGADPDSPPRLVVLPAAWDDAAASAVAALAPGHGPV